jgi:hypothetical protein
MTDPCLHLWRAVLLAGLHDAGSGVETGWIGSRDFRTVCALAGLKTPTERGPFPFRGRGALGQAFGPAFFPYRSRMASMRACNASLRGGLLEQC